jgi:uncharacterized protein YprB with RNaseH-like and TPR domain
MTDDFTERLKLLGVTLGVPSSPGNQRPQKRFLIDEVINGEFRSTIFGNIFVVKKEFPVQNTFGQTVLETQNDGLQKIADCAKVGKLSQYRLDKCLFLDTETTGLSGGTGTLAFLIGLGWYEGDSFSLMQIFLRDFSDEPAALAFLTEVVSSFHILVTFNGKGFDLPLLTGRHIINSITNPFIHFDHLDLLPIARKIWRRRLDDRSLGNLEKEILHTHRTEEEIPGWMVPQIYFDYLNSGDARPLKGVFYHNEIDILSMVRLLSHLTDFFCSPGINPEHNSVDISALGTLYEQRGDIPKAVELYNQSIKLGLPEKHHTDTTMRLAVIAKRHKDWLAAQDLWIQAANQNEFSAIIELAKYYEHHGNDLEAARVWVVKAIDLANSSNQRHYQMRKIIADLSHRINRIDHKIKQKKEKECG